MTETWYVMEDGSTADPRDVSPGKDGLLRHKDGRAVEYKPHGPRTRGVEPNEERAKAQPKPKPQPRSRDMRPDDSRPGYTTRESKSE